MSDVLSLFAQGSRMESSRPTVQGGHTLSQSQIGSTQDIAGDQELAAIDVLSTVLSAAKVVGLSMLKPKLQFRVSGLASPSHSQ